MKLKRNWKRIARRSWCIQFLGAGVLLSGLSTALPYLAPIVPNRWAVPYAVLIFFVTVAAGARLLRQKGLEC